MRTKRLGIGNREEETSGGKRKERDSSPETVVVSRQEVAQAEFREGESAGCRTAQRARSGWELVTRKYVQSRCKWRGSPIPEVAFGDAIAINC